jgi:hypothetical protein
LDLIFITIFFQLFIYLDTDSNCVVHLLFQIWRRIGYGSYRVRYDDSLILVNTNRI